MTPKPTQTEADQSRQDAASPTEQPKRRLRTWTRKSWSRSKPDADARPVIDLDLDLTVEDLMSDLDPGWLMRRDALSVTEDSVRTETTTIR